MTEERRAGIPTHTSSGQTECPGSARILVVDDEAAMRDMLNTALSREGFDVVTARDGDEAVAVLGTHRFDVVLTDLHMPGTTGEEVIASLRERDPDTQVVVMTGNATLETAIASMRQGAYDYIEKPFELAELSSVLRRAVEAGQLRGMIALFEASRTMLGTLGSSDVVPRILELAAGFPRIDAVHLALRRSSGEPIVIHSHPEGGPAAPSASMVQDMAQRAIEAGRPLMYPESAMNGDDTLTTREPVSVLAYPLIVGDRTLGGLLLWRAGGQRAFSVVEFRQGSVLAAEAAMALENARLYGELQERMEELMAARLQLLQSEKLAATGRLAAGVAHEINTPTQFVGDSIQFLREGIAQVLPLLESYRSLREAAAVGELDPARLTEIARAEEEADLGYLEEQIPRAIERSLEGVSRIADIVRAMKEFAHPDRKEKAPADLNRALRSTLTVAGNEIKYVADVVTDFGDLPSVTCRIGDLNQVFLNLLVNAAHTIGDKVGTTGQKGTITVRTRPAGDRVVVEIADTGCGIPESAREKIFEPFFTTKEVGRGTGQGLAIAHSIVVERHGGTIDFETAVGKGTTFRVGIPLEERGAPVGAGAKG